MVWAWLACKSQIPRVSPQRGASFGGAMRTLAKPCHALPRYAIARPSD